MALHSADCQQSRLQAYQHFCWQQAWLLKPETEFVTWARRTENFVASVMTGARDVLTWAVELDP
eukprot:2609611-Amphidinium_carterae.1